MSDPMPFGGAAPLDLDSFQSPSWSLSDSVDAVQPPAPAQRLVKAARPAVLASRWRSGQIDVPAQASLKIGAQDDSAVRRRLVRVLKNSTPGYVRIGQTDSAAMLGFELDAPTIADHGAVTELMSAGPVFVFNTHATQTQTVAYLIEYVDSVTGPVTDLEPDDSALTIGNALDRFTSRLDKLLDLLSPFRGNEHDEDGAGSPGVAGVNSGGR